MTMPTFYPNNNFRMKSIAALLSQMTKKKKLSTFSNGGLMIYHLNRKKEKSIRSTR